MFYEKNIKHILANQPNLLEHLAIENLSSPSTAELISIADCLDISTDRLLRRDLTMDVYAKAKEIKLLILDVDGVMTDGGMYFTENGDQFKKYNTKDGMGIIHLTKKGFQIGIISSGFKGEAVKSRAELLGIQNFYLGRGKKMDVLQEWCTRMDITLDQVAMIGDDVNDLPVLKSIGLSICPSNAVKVVREASDIILEQKGGEGCVREFIDEFLPFEVEY